jgi:hemolysin activation/secretion protein
MVPPQGISDGRVQIQVIEGSITQVDLRGAGAEQCPTDFNPVLSEHPSRLATLSGNYCDQQFTRRRHHRHFPRTDLRASGRFRIVIRLKTWHFYAFTGLDNLGSSSIGPWQAYRTAAYNSLLTPGDTLAVNLATLANDPHQLGFGRISYDTPVGTMASGWAVRRSTARSVQGIQAVYNDVTTTEAFELNGSLVPIQSQHQKLALTVAAGFSNVSESDVFGKCLR